MSKEPSDRTKTQIGRMGEELAVQHLLAKGYEVHCLNYRFGRSEIDIIAFQNKTVVFVEVKYRTNLMFGYPESFVDAAKEGRIKTAAENYIFEKNWHGDIRFDVIAIVDTKSDLQIEHFEDCF